jgi:hypothetical protein
MSALLWKVQVVPDAFRSLKFLCISALCLSFTYPGWRELREKEKKKKKKKRKKIPGGLAGAIRPCSQLFPISKHRWACSSCLTLHRTVMHLKKSV